MWKLIKSNKPTSRYKCFSDVGEIWNLIKETKGKKFIPIVITDFVRECIDINWFASKLEIALDCGFVQGNERKSPICEVEIELKSGRMEDLLSLKMNLVKNLIYKFLP